MDDATRQGMYERFVATEQRGDPYEGMVLNYPDTFLTLENARLM